MEYPTSTTFTGWSVPISSEIPIRALLRIRWTSCIRSTSTPSPIHRLELLEPWARNSLQADWGRNLDLSFFRTFRVTDTKRFEFQAEAFNVNEHTGIRGSGQLIFRTDRDTLA